MDEWLKQARHRSPVAGPCKRCEVNAAVTRVDGEPLCGDCILSAWWRYALAGHAEDVPAPHLPPVRRRKP